MLYVQNAKAAKLLALTRHQLYGYSLRKKVWVVSDDASELSQSGVYQICDPLPPRSVTRQFDEAAALEGGEL